MRKADYGIDAPGVVRNLFVLGGVLLLAALVGPSRVGPFAVGGTSVTLGVRGMLAGGAISCLLGGALMILYAEVGKFRHRDRMLAMIPWTGAENVLDVGTGRGLLAIGAARKLTTGRAVGIDIWNAADLTGNTPDAFLANAEAEGVAERIEVRSADARRMPFPDASFDVVLSNVCLHNIPDVEGRAEACREIGRVLRPGGVALVSDFRETALYAAAFREADFSVERSVSASSKPIRRCASSRPASRRTEPAIALAVRGPRGFTCGGFLPDGAGLGEDATPIRHRAALEDRERRREPARAPRGRPGEACPDELGAQVPASGRVT